jgi:hypothetical protein
MRFVELKESRPVDLNAVGKVEYVAWRVVPVKVNGKDELFTQLYPNNCTVNGRTLVANSSLPEDAWSLVLGKADLLKQFGIEV